MEMNLRNRVERLEMATEPATPGECKCFHSTDVRYYDGAAEAEADTTHFDEACGVCGGERRLIKVVYAPPGEWENQS